MTKKNAAQAVAAALVAALGFGTVVAPAVAMAEPANDNVAIVAQSVGSDDAIDAAVNASPIGWGDVADIDWYYDCGRDDYVVTVTAFSGAWWTIWVDATTGGAYAIA